MIAPTVEVGFTVKRLVPANPNNDRGKRTWEWKLPDGRQITIYRRRKGEKFAAHFHKGEDPTKNPERFVLLEGRMWMDFEDVDGNRKETVLDAKKGKKQPELTVEVGVLHTAIALTNCLYIEYRRQYFDPGNPDTYPAEAFTAFAQAARL